MRKFKQTDFTWIDGDLMVAEASYLGMPPGGIMRQFEVEDFGIFTYKQTNADLFHYENGKGVSIDVFND